MRWLLLYTLVRNPVLIADRKHHLKSKSLARETTKRFMKLFKKGVRGVLGVNDLQEPNFGNRPKTGMSDDVRWIVANQNQEKQKASEMEYTIDHNEGQDNVNSQISQTNDEQSAVYVDFSKVKND